MLMTLGGGKSGLLLLSIYLAVFQTIVILAIHSCAHRVVLRQAFSHNRVLSVGFLEYVLYLLAAGMDAVI